MECERIMGDFKLERTQQFGTIETRLYSFHEKNNDLRTYIQNKIQQPSGRFEDLLDSFAGDNLDKESLLETFNKLSTSQNHPIPAFDVKRSTVTEFMAEFLLEKEFQCIFFEQNNKKLNKSIVDANRHSTGVDVVGIQENSEELKFVVAEVKASQDNSIPCPSARDLKKDIETVLDLTNNRLLREIMAMSESFKQGSGKFEKYIQFLLDLIQKQNAPDLFFKRIIIFPFLIRNNPIILKQKNLNDFQNFSELDARGSEISGIVWAINKDIEDFVKSVYQ